VELRFVLTVLAVAVGVQLVRVAVGEGISTVYVIGTVVAIVVMLAAMRLARARSA
jgi:hypothetical protein